MNELRKFAVPLLFVVYMLAAKLSNAQESVCDLFSHLKTADGRQLVIAGELIVSKDFAAIGASDCENDYVTALGSNVFQQWPTALRLRASQSLPSKQLQKFQAAGLEADRLRKLGKEISASGSFSGRMTVKASGTLPGEFTFDSIEELKVEMLPDASTLTVIPICELFQNLPAWKGKRIAVRGAFVSTFEGAWISGRCKGSFYTNGYRWPVVLDYAVPSYYSSDTAPFIEAKQPSSPPKGAEELKGRQGVIQTATYVGRLRMRSEYQAVCGERGEYMTNGFGHLNSATAELLVEAVMDVELTPQVATDAVNVYTEEQRCTPPDLATLCSKADTLVRAASIGCTDRVREFLAKDGIDAKNGGESMSLRAAILSGNEPIAKLLLDAGAPFDPVEAAQSPLAEAAFARQIGIMKLLLAAGAKVDSVDHHGVTFLVDSGVFDPRVITVLVEAGANVDATNGDGETVLMKASSLTSSEQTIKVLIEHHGDLNLRDNKGRTAVMHAASSCCSDAIPLLLQNGADPNARDNDGKTALDLAEASHNLGAIAILSYATKRSH